MGSTCDLGDLIWGLDASGFEDKRLRWPSPGLGLVLSLVSSERIVLRAAGQVEKSLGYGRSGGKQAILLYSPKPNDNQKTVC